MSYHNVNEPKTPILFELLVDFFGSFIAFVIFIGAPLLGLGVSHKSMFLLGVVAGGLFAFYMLLQRRLRK